MTTRGIEVLANLLAVAVIARYLGVEDFGIYSFLMAMVWVISPYLILGLPRILAREISRDQSNANELIGVGIKLIALMSVPVIIGILIYYKLFHADIAHVYALLLSIIGMVSIATTRVLNASFVALERMKYETYVTFFSSLSFLLLTSISVYLNLGLLYFFIAFVLSSLMGLMGTIYISMKRFLIRPKIDLSLTGIKGLFWESAPIAVSQFLFQTYAYMGIFVLKYFFDNYSVGLFQAPSRIIIRTQVIPMSIMIALFPLLSRLAISDPSRDEIRKIVLTVIKCLLMFSLPFSIIGFALSDTLISVIFGHGFLESSIIFRFLILGINVSFIIVIFESLTISLNRQRTLITINTIALMGALILNVVLVFRLNYIGAGIAVPLSDTALICTYLFFLRDTVKAKQILTAIAKPLLAAMLMGCFIYMFSILHSIIILIVSILLYFTLLCIMKTLSLDELRHLKMMLRDRKPTIIILGNPPALPGDSRSLAIPGI